MKADYVNHGRQSIELITNTLLIIEEGKKSHSYPEKCIFFQLLLLLPLLLFFVSFVFFFFFFFFFFCVICLWHCFGVCFFFVLVFFLCVSGVVFSICFVSICFLRKGYNRLTSLNSHHKDFTKAVRFDPFIYHSSSLNLCKIIYGLICQQLIFFEQLKSPHWICT